MARAALVDKLDVARENRDAAEQRAKEATIAMEDANAAKAAMEAERDAAARAAEDAREELRMARARAAEVAK